MAKTPEVHPTLSPVSLKLKGHEYQLCFDYNSLAVAEKVTGKSYLMGLSFEHATAAEVRALFYAALLMLQPDTTLEAAGALITPSNAPKVVKAIVDAYIESHEPDEDELKNVQEPK